VTLVLLVVSSIAYAGGSKEGTASKGPFIGVSVPSADHGWTGAVIKDAQAALKSYNVQGTVLTAADVNKQSNDIEDLIAQKVSAIVILPLEGSPLTPAATDVLAAKIPLVNFDRELDNQQYSVLLKGNNRGIGVNAAKWLIEKLGGKGNVFMLSGPPVSVTTERDNGFKDTIKGTDIKVVGLQDGGYQREKGYTVMQNALTAYPEIDAVFSIDDEMSLGALQAIKEAGRTDIKYLSGAGGEKHFFEAIKNEKNIELATFLYSPTMIKDAVKVAIDIASGKAPSEKVIVEPAARVDRANVDQYYDPNSNY